MNLTAKILTLRREENILYFFNTGFKERFIMIEQVAEEFERRSQPELRLITPDSHQTTSHQSTSHQPKGVVTVHPEMQKIFRTIEKVSQSQSTVLILGESGTGKELIARAIHDQSRREHGKPRGPFVPVNCGAIPDALLESELFGHEKGAFTGAISSRMGRFVLADHGTIFLDEIGEMSPHLQVKLLRVLQERVVEPVGGTRSRPISVRVIAATHQNLQELVKQGRFREDLFYRLQVVPVEVPALRNRASDIPVLLEYFSKKYSEQNGRSQLKFSSDAVSMLLQHRWPGNIRELENLIERLTLLVDADTATAQDLPDYFHGAGLSTGAFSTGLFSTGSLSIFDRQQFPSVEGDGIDFNSLVEEFENTLILQALQKTKGNKKAAAKLLNLNRTTLVEKIKKKNLAAEGGDDDES
jgi:DNA-binding NtrC family response regulator